MLSEASKLAPNQRSRRRRASARTQSCPWSQTRSATATRPL